MAMLMCSLCQVDISADAPGGDSPVATMVATEEAASGAIDAARAGITELTVLVDVDTDAVAGAGICSVRGLEQLSQPQLQALAAHVQRHLEQREAEAAAAARMAYVASAMGAAVEEAQ